MARARSASKCAHTLAVATLLAVAGLMSAQPVSRATQMPDARGAWRMRDGGVVALYQSESNDSGWHFVDFRSGASHQLYVRDSMSFFVVAQAAHTHKCSQRLRTTWSLQRVGCDNSPALIPRALVWQALAKADGSPRSQRQKTLASDLCLSATA
jgi:hypothetical protein